VKRKEKKRKEKKRKEQKRKGAVPQVTAKATLNERSQHIQ
jgi:hypothetical protein